jgi:thymidylate kinase
MVDVINSILQYSWRNEEYIIFVRYLLGTAYLPSPIDRIAFHFFDTLVPKPEKMLFIDIKPEVAYRRIIKRTKSTREMFEEPEALRKTRDKGLSLAWLAKWHIVDGSKSPAEVEYLIRNLLELDSS